MKEHIILIGCIILFIAFIAIGTFAGVIINRNKKVEKEDPFIPCDCEGEVNCNKECTLRKMLKKNLYPIPNF